MLALFPTYFCMQFCRVVENSTSCNGKNDLLRFVMPLPVFASTCGQTQEYINSCHTDWHILLKKYKSRQEVQTNSYVPAFFASSANFTDKCQLTPLFFRLFFFQHPKIVTIFLGWEVIRTFPCRLWHPYISV